MQVDLFKNKHYCTDYRRITKQIETREFKIVNKEYLDALKYLNIEHLNAQLVEEYREQLLDLQGKKRSYKNVCNATTDSHFELEALGIGSYTKKYICILDFSDKLDFILHCLCGCPQEDIRKISNYHEVSKAILNCSFNQVHDINLNCLFDVSPQLDQFFIKILHSVESSKPTHLQNEYFVYSVYGEILRKLAEIRDYTVIFTSKQIVKDCVYRSKSLSSAIITTDEDISSNNLELIYDNNLDEVCCLKYKVYRTFEYTQEGIRRYELSR